MMGLSRRPRSGNGPPSWRLKLNNSWKHLLLRKSSLGLYNPNKISGLNLPIRAWLGDQVEKELLELLDDK
jgi:hypothetical protein